MKSLVAVGQMTSNETVNDNLLACQRLTAQAAAHGAKLLCLPENFSFLGVEDQDNKQVADTLESATLAPFLALAKEYQIWLSLGGFPEQGDGNAHPYNTHLIVDPSGKIQASYRKTHLFDGNLDETKHISKPKAPNIFVK